MIRKIKTHRIPHMGKLLLLGFILGLPWGLFYLLVFIIPQKVSFSYAQTTCVSDITLLPNLYSVPSGSAYKVTHDKHVSIGNWNLASSRTCFEPLQVPGEGVSAVSNTPLGSGLFRKNYRLSVAEAPMLLSTSNPSPLSAVALLRLDISGQDQVFQYRMVLEDKTHSCTKDASSLVCDLSVLKLQQGEDYSVALERVFNGETVAKLAELQLTTLDGPQVLSTSIGNGTTIIASPKNLDLMLDKPISEAKVKLESLDGEAVVELPVTVVVEGAVIKSSWQDELPRGKKIRFTVSGATATDGTILEKPYEVLFNTSSGPQVSGANIGTGGVDPSAKIILTFDQPLADNTKVEQYVAIEGVAAKISRQGANQIALSLSGAKACQAFKITVAPGIVSSYGVVSQKGWSYDSRINCRQTKTIGYSVNGTAIQAYYYGSGASKVLFTGGIHGNEVSGIYIMQDWAKELDLNGYKIPADKQVVIVPSLNPDGTARSSRYNKNNVNLARNFPSSDWATDISVSGGGTLAGGGGSAPLSEPEANALANLTSSLMPRLILSFHSQGSLVGANQRGDSASIGKLYAQTVGYTTMFGNAEEVMGYSITGEYETWAGEDLNVPAVLVELPTHTGRYFGAHKNMLWKVLGL